MQYTTFKNHLRGMDVLDDLAWEKCNGNGHVGHPVSPYATLAYEICVPARELPHVTLHRQDQREDADYERYMELEMRCLLIQEKTEIQTSVLHPNRATHGELLMGGDPHNAMSPGRPHGDALHRPQQHIGKVMLTSEVQVHPEKDINTYMVSTSCSYEYFSLIQIRMVVLSSLVSSMGTLWTDEFLEAAAAIPAAADDGQVDYDARWKWVSLITQLPRPELHQNTRLFRVYKGSVLPIPDALVNFPIGADAWESLDQLVPLWPHHLTCSSGTPSTVS